MTPEEIAAWLSCPVCGGRVKARTSKPWYFSCAACPYTHRPSDIAALKRAVQKKLSRAGLDKEPAPPAPIKPRSGCTRPVHADDYYLPDRVAP